LRINSKTTARSLTRWPRTGLLGTLPSNHRHGLVVVFARDDSLAEDGGGGKGKEGKGMTYERTAHNGVWAFHLSTCCSFHIESTMHSARRLGAKFEGGTCYIMTKSYIPSNEVPQTIDLSDGLENLQAPTVDDFTSSSGGSA